MIAETHVVILAAGQGTRMKSELPKVLHPVAGRLDDRARPGHRPRCLSDVDHADRRATGRSGSPAARRRGRTWPFAVQEPQLGTAHALQQAEPILTGRTGHRWSCCPATCRCSRPPPSGRSSRPTSRRRRAATVVDGGRRTPIRLRPNRPHGRPDRANRRGAGRVARRAADSGDQRRHLRLRPGAAVRRAAGHRRRRTRRASST